MPSLTLDAKDWIRVSALLDQALDLDPAERGGWLDRLPAADLPYRPVLEELLRGGPSATSDFLQRPAVPALEAAVAAGTAHPALAPGRTVGPYRLIRELGSGGMGAVWLAERADGQLRRQVALKLPIASWAPDLAQRMARERDIQATLEHPNIARLYDAGMDAEGRPYLAMEYVDGVPIDRFVAEQALPIRARLALFLQIARAMTYAHARLIVHRDIKPSNVLVDRDGRARLLDFGIAKLIRDETGSDAGVTEFAGRALTPDYAAPEQIRGEAVTVATDVYALGVLLYELLTGQRPYRFERSSRAAVEQAVLTLEPALPSLRATASDRALLRGDLDAITHKALKKLPSERYPSVEALAEDIERHLDGQPVRARPDSVPYRMRKFLRRHALAVGAAAALFVALAGGLAATIWQAGEARRQRDLAVEQQQRAEQASAEAFAAQRRESVQAELARSEARRASEREAEAQEQRALAVAASTRAARAAEQARAEAARARATQEFLVDVFRTNSADQDDPELARRTTARELLDRGAARIDSALADEPDARREMTRTLSSMYADLGLAERSSELARKALQLTEKLYGPDSLETANALLDYVIALEQGGRETDERLQLATRARGIADRHGAAPLQLRWRIEMATSGALENRDPAQARRHAATAVDFARGLGDRRLLQRALYRAGALAAQGNDALAAEPLLAEALAIGETLPTFGASDRTRTRVLLADAQGRLFRLEAAEASLRRALADSARANGADHLDTRQTQLRLGVFLITSAERPREAVDVLRQVAEASSRPEKPDPFTAAPAFVELTRALVTVGDYVAAEDAIRRALEIRENFRPGTMFTANIREVLSLVLVRQGRFDEAVRELEEAEALRVKLGDRPGSTSWESGAEYRYTLAVARGDYGDAARRLQVMQQGRLERVNATRGWMNAALRRARVAVETGDVEGARAYMSHIDSILEQRGIRTQVAIFEGQRLAVCGRIAERAGRTEEARSHYRRAIALITSRADAENGAAREARRWLERLPPAAESVAPPESSNTCAGRGSP